MSFPAAHDLKEQVREATDIVALLSKYLNLTPQGRNFVALCPFHDDTKPSLTINPERQTWKCWPCDSGGDVFSFVMQRENVDFPGAMRILAEMAGIEWRQHAPKTTPGSANDKSTLYKAMEWAEKQFHQCLLESTVAATARDYLRNRKVTEESVDRYKIGFAPNEWQWLADRARSTEYSPAVLEALGLLVRNEKGRTYDRFRGRVMFPIRDTQNRAIAVGGRILPEFADDRSAKYINSPETRLYSKSEQLYGLNLCREALEQQRKKNQARNVIVMEGYTDVVVSRQEGIQTPVAVCGTALTSKHLTVLKRYADQVTLVLDGDEAGQKRAAEVLELFVAGQMELRMVTLPDGQDPCDFVLEHGSAALEELIAQSPDALDFCVENETRGIDLANDTQRANASLQRILATMARAPRLKEDSNSSYRLRTQQTLSRLSRMYRVDESLLREELASQRAKATENSNRFASNEEEQKPKRRVPLSGWEKELFTRLIQTPNAVAAVIERVSPEDMRTEMGKTLLVTYQEIEATGEEPEYQRVMDATEDPQLKNTLVELVEDADRIQPEDPDAQLAQLLSAFSNRREEIERREQRIQIESGKLNEQEELELLNKLFESKRFESQ